MPLEYTVFSSRPACVAAWCCHINTQEVCCILLTFQWQGLLPISQRGSWVTCSFSGVCRETKSFTLQDITLSLTWNRTMLSNHKKQGWEGEVGVFWYSTVRVGSVAVNILWQWISRGVIVLTRGGLIRTLPVRLNWPESLCAGQYVDETRVCGKYSSVLKWRTVYRWLSAH